MFNSGVWDVPTSIASDASVILYTTLREPALRAEVWVMSAAGTQRDGTPLIKRPFDQGQAQLSPDRRRIAYVSNETGANEVFVAELQFDQSTGAATVGEGVAVSSGGGLAPRWRGDGKELFYLKVDGSVMAVQFKPAPGLSDGAAIRLFQVSGVIPEWGVTQDGRRFLFAVPTAEPPPFDIVRNWQELLAR